MLSRELGKAVIYRDSRRSGRLLLGRKEGRVGESACLHKEIIGPGEWCF